MSAPYIFVAAAVLAVLPNLFIFKISMDRIKEFPDQLEKAQSFYFIGLALSEIIPIILVIFGFIHLNPVKSIDELFIPGIIVLLTMGFAAFFIFLQRTIDITEEMKVAATSFAMIAFSTVNAIPIIAIVSFFIMMP